MQSGYGGISMNVWIYSASFSMKMSVFYKLKMIFHLLSRPTDDSNSVLLLENSLNSQYTYLD